MSPPQERPYASRPAPPNVRSPAKSAHARRRAAAASRPRRSARYRRRRAVAANAGVDISAGGPAAAPFVADEDFTGGTTAAVTNAISTTGITNPAPQSVWQHNRYGNFTYTIPGLTAGASYTVRLDFAEEYWTAAGSRTFNVLINGTQVLTNFDIFATAGGEYKASPSRSPPPRAARARSPSSSSRSRTTPRSTASRSPRSAAPATPSRSPAPAARPAPSAPPPACRSARPTPPPARR